MNGEELANPVQIQNNSSESRIVVDLRTIDHNRDVFVPCPKCGRPLVIGYNKTTKCPCGIEICRSDDDFQTIESEVVFK